MAPSPSSDALERGFADERGSTPDEHVAGVLRAMSRDLLGAEVRPRPDARALGRELARCVDDREDASLAGALGDLHVEDLALALAARSGDAAAVSVFEREWIAPLRSTVARIDGDSAFVDEVLQRVRTKLLVAEGNAIPKLARYRGRGELATWLRVVAAREAVTVRRGEGRRALAGDDDLVAIEASTTGPELGAVREQYRDAFREAFSRALAGLSAEQRNVLRLHYLHGMTVDELGVLLRVHRSNAARRVAKARDELLSATRRGLAGSLAIGRHEFEELMGLIASRIDVSIERHLG